jgi:hypothetical protein
VSNYFRTRAMKHLGTSIICQLNACVKNKDIFFAYTYCSLHIFYHSIVAESTRMTEIDILKRDMHGGAAI